MGELYTFDITTKHKPYAGLTDYSHVSYDPVNGKEILPAYATKDKPPVTGENEVACRVGTSWEKKDDYRGETYWTADGVKHVISEIGVSVPEDASLEEPVKEEPIEEEPSEEERTRINDDEARTKRHFLLSDSDCLMLADYPIDADERELWDVYRQSLRDITEQEGFPNDITWPTKPAK